MAETFCGGCGRRMDARKLHYHGEVYRGGVLWLCSVCHPAHPADEPEPPDALAQQAARLGVAVAAVAPAQPQHAVAARTATAPAAVTVSTPVLKRHVGWPKGMKRSGLRGKAIRPDV